MMPGHHQDMTGVDWLVVHECNDLVILIDHAPLSWPLMRRQSVQLSSTSIGTTTACQLSTGLSWRFRDSTGRVRLGPGSPCRRRRLAAQVECGERGASSAVVGPHRVARAVHGDLAAVREDPLRPCVPKRYADAYPGLRVVTRNCFDRDVTLGGTMGRSVVERGSGSVEVGGRRPSDEHGVHRGEHPRSPRDRRIQPNSRAGMSSSLDSTSSTPPASTAGSASKRPAVRIHWIPRCSLPTLARSQPAAARPRSMVRSVHGRRTRSAPPGLSILGRSPPHSPAR